MAASPSFNFDLDTLPTTRSSRIIEDDAPQRDSIDLPRDEIEDDEVPGAVANIGPGPPVGRRRHSKKYSTGKRFSGTKRFSGIRYSGSSDTIENSELVDYLIAHREPPLPIPDREPPPAHFSGYGHREPPPPHLSSFSHREPPPPHLSSFSHRESPQTLLGSISHREQPAPQFGSFGRDNGAYQHLGTQQPEPADQNSHYSRSSSSHDLEKGSRGGSRGSKNPSPQGNQNGGAPKPAQEENNVVGFDGPTDPLNPQNWPKSKKYTITGFYSSMTFCCTFASSIFSTATEVTAKQYHVSNEVMTLGTSLFVLVSDHAPHHPFHALTTRLGVRRRPHNVGPSLRTLRSEASSLRRVFSSCHLPNTRRRGPKH